MNDKPKKPQNEQKSGGGITPDMPLHEQAGPEEGSPQSGRQERRSIDNPLTRIRQAEMQRNSHRRAVSNGSDEMTPGDEAAGESAAGKRSPGGDPGLDRALAIAKRLRRTIASANENESPMQAMSESHSEDRKRRRFEDDAAAKAPVDTSEPPLKPAETDGSADVDAVTSSAVPPSEEENRASEAKARNAETDPDAEALSFPEAPPVFPEAPLPDPPTFAETTEDAFLADPADDEEDETDRTEADGTTETAGTAETDKMSESDGPSESDGTAKQSGNAGRPGEDTVIPAPETSPAKKPRNFKQAAEPERSSSTTVSDEDEENSASKPPDAERLRKRLDKYPEGRGEARRKFKLNLNRTSHRRGLVAGIILIFFLIGGTFALVQRSRNMRAAYQALVEERILTMQASKGNAPNEQTVRHSDPQRIVTASIPYFGDALIDQYTQILARKIIDDFESLSDRMPPKLPDRRPILSVSHQTHIVEGELATIRIVAETYLSAKDLEEGKSHSFAEEQVLYDLSYRCFLDARDIFKEGGEKTLAGLGTAKLQSGQYELVTLAAPGAYRRLIESDKPSSATTSTEVAAPDAGGNEATESVPGAPEEPAAPAVEAGSGTRLHNLFGVKTLRAQEPADPAAAEGADAPKEITIDETNAPEKAAGPVEKELQLPKASEEKAASSGDNPYGGVVLPETTILYKHLTFKPEGLELRPDPALLPVDSPDITIFYDYADLLGTLRFETRAEGGYRLNLRIDPLGDTHRSYEAGILADLYGTSPYAPVEVPPVAPSAAGTSSPEATGGTEARSADNLFFAAKRLRAEEAHAVDPQGSVNPNDAVVVEPSGTSSADPADPAAAATEDNKTTTTETTAAPQATRAELFISRNLNMAGELSREGLSIRDHFAVNKARYGQEIRYVALTFNNAPQAETNENLLKLLDVYRGHGTFFVRGLTAVEDSADAGMQAIIEQGSEIGNNAYNTYEFVYLTGDQIRAEINETADLIEQKIGVRPTILRPPFGSYNDDILAVADVPFVTWSFSTGDELGASTADIIATMNQYIEPGAIVLFSEGYETTLEALRKTMPELYGQGYRFVTVSELFEIYSEDGLQNGKAYSSAWS